MSAPALEMHGLDVRIGAVQVTRGLWQRMQRGEYWALLGPNGSGKTTLLLTLAGIRAPAAGEVRLFGRALADWPRRRLARRLGMLQQNTQYTFDATVLETALVGRHPHLRPWVRESNADLCRARATLERLELSDLESRRCTTLSGGEARRLALATLFVQDPQVMLLDEPNNHLDLKHQHAVMQALRQTVTTDKRLVVAALHSLHLAQRYCSHALLLFPGGEVCGGPIDVMLQPDLLAGLYEVEPDQLGIT